MTAELTPIEAMPLGEDRRYNALINTCSPTAARDDALDAPAPRRWPGTVLDAQTGGRAFGLISSTPTKNTLRRRHQPVTATGCSAPACWSELVDCAWPRSTP